MTTTRTINRWRALGIPDHIIIAQDRWNRESRIACAQLGGGTYREIGRFLNVSGNRAHQIAEAVWTRKHRGLSPIERFLLAPFVFNRREEQILRAALERLFPAPTNSPPGEQMIGHLVRGALGAE